MEKRALSRCVRCDKYKACTLELAGAMCSACKLAENPPPPNA